MSWRSAALCLSSTLLLIGPLEAQCSSTNSASFETPAGLNYVIEFESFPVAHGLRDHVEAAMERAANEWDESGCNSGAIFPTTPPVSSFNAAPNDRAVNLIVKSEPIGPLRDCQPGSQQKCSALASAIPPDQKGLITIVFYQKKLHFDQVQDNVAEWGDVDRLAIVLAHEIGHALGLGHDECANSIMTPVLPHAQDPALFNLGVQQGHCDRVEDNFDQVDPLDTLLIPDRCRLSGYCDLLNEPWFVAKPICYWTETWAIVTTVDQFGEVETAETRYRDYGCIDAYGATGATEVAQWVHEPVPSPRLALIPPTDAVAPPELTVRGWAYSGQLPVRQFGFWIDGVWTVPNALLDEMYSPALCATGFDAGNCSVTSGFEAHVPIDGLANGTHLLEVVVTNHWDEPLPVYLSYDFEVDRGDPPVAVDDEATAGYGVLQYPTHTDIRDTSVDILVLENDYDPDGGSVSVVRIVAQPESGSAEVLPNGSIRYTTDGANPGSPTFSYEIEDEEGDLDRGIVEVTVRSWLVVVSVQPPP